MDERFWSKVVCDIRTQCWLWVGSIGRDGYGHIRIGGKVIGAHTVSWTLHHGAVPNELFVCHNCPSGDRKDCVNPAHLWLGTNQENIRDSFTKGRTMPRGEAGHHVLLTDDDVLEIRRLYAAGWTQVNLAELFEVTQPHISDIVRRKYWTHI